MLEKFLNKKVLICIAHYASTIEKYTSNLSQFQRKGTVTNVDDCFIELDNNEVIAIKYITTIKSL